jgi:negative regulator of flagellin synthesis FlgM
MVDSVRNSPQASTSAVHDHKKSRVSTTETTGVASKAKTAEPDTSVQLSLSVSDKVKSMASEPPINIELVNEIRQKVSQGRYPIDLNSITNKMFESIKNG